jgi:TetR/AcrR family transcriptional regulator, cholesterol catabolism regulator
MTPPVRERRANGREARWNEVLSAAFEVFVEQGYEAATVEEIASRVGLLKGSLYYYIESKEALLFALFKRSYDDALDNIAAHEELRCGDATTRLLLFIELFVENLRSKGSEAGHRLIRQEFHRLTPDHRRQIRAQAEVIESHFLEIVSQGVADGEFDAETDPEVAVHSIFSILNNVSWDLRRGDKSWSSIVAWHQRFLVQGLGGDLSQCSEARRVH